MSASNVSPSRMSNPGNVVILAGVAGTVKTIGSCVGEVEEVEVDDGVVIIMKW